MWGNVCKRRWVPHGPCWASQGEKAPLLGWKHMRCDGEHLSSPAGPPQGNSSLLFLMEGISLGTLAPSSKCLWLSIRAQKRVCLLTLSP